MNISKKAIILLVCISAVILNAQSTDSPVNPSDRPGPPGPPGPSDRPSPPGPHDHPPPPPPPPFLQNVTDDGRKAYFVIVNNQNLTIQQIDDETEEWASTYQVSDEYKQFEEQQNELKNEMKKNVSEIVGNLAAVEESLNTILDNKDQTRNAQQEAIKELKDKYPIEIDTLVFISNYFGPQNPLPQPPQPPQPPKPHHHGHRGQRGSFTRNF